MTENRLKEIIQEVLDSNLNREPLVEMARINLKDQGNTPFPANKFEIKLWSNDHNPPHFHILYDGWNISFTIEDGKELEVISIGTHSSDYKYIVKNVPIWLDMKCSILPLITNRQNAITQWQQLHETEL